MHIAERLYLRGFMTYPRTESTSYPKAFDFNGITKALQNNPEFSYIKDLSFQNAKKGVDAGDHPPITPTTMVPSSLSYDEQKIYNYVC